MSWRQSSVAPPPLSEKNALPSAPPTGPSVLPYVTWLHCCGIIHSIAAVAPCGWFTARYKNTGEAVAVHPSVRPSVVRHLYGRVEQADNASAEKKETKRGSSRRASRTFGTLFLLWLEGSGSPSLSSPFPTAVSVGWGRSWANTAVTLPDADGTPRILDVILGPLGKGYKLCNRDASRLAR